MIVGKVLSTGEAVVTLGVRGPGGQARVETVVDTGFNDELTLPRWVIERLGLRFETQAFYRLADGAKSGSRVFVGEVEWHGTWREMSIVEIEQDALLGMEALKGCGVYLEVVVDGRVEIELLKSQREN